MRKEGNVQRAHRQQPVAKKRRREPCGGKHQEEVVLGDTQLNVLSLGSLHPLIHAHHAGGLGLVRAFLRGELPALIQEA